MVCVCDSVCVCVCALTLRRPCRDKIYPCKFFSHHFLSLALLSVLCISLYNRVPVVVYGTCVCTQEHNKSVPY